MFGRANMRVAIIDVMLDLMHSAARIAKAPGVSRPGGRCVEVADQKRAAGDADARQLVIGVLQRLQMAEHKPAPDEVERLRGERKFAHICGSHVCRLTCLQHFKTGINAGSKRCIDVGKAPPGAASRIEQPFAAGRWRKRACQFIFDETDGRFARVSGRPKAVGLARRQRGHCAAPSNRRCP